MRQRLVDIRAIEVAEASADTVAGLRTLRH
jgi:hypothetical protein